MRTSKRGIDLVRSFEGLRLKAYKCPAGVWTIGYGHTGAVHEGDKITEEDAIEYLEDDLDRFEKCVDKAVNVPITQNMFDALVSFAYNVGCGAFKKSALLKKLNAKDYEGAADQFPRWNKAGGRELAGLTRRRAAERAMFLEAAEVKA
jgi:lysozyme